MKPIDTEQPDSTTVDSGIPEELLDHAAASTALAMIAASEMHGPLTEEEQGAWAEVRKHVMAIQDLVRGCQRQTGHLPVQGIILIRALGHGCLQEGAMAVFHADDCPDLPGLMAVTERRIELQKKSGMRVTEAGV